MMQGITNETLDISIVNGTLDAINALIDNSPDRKLSI